MRPKIMLRNIFFSFGLLIACTNTFSQKIENVRLVEIGKLLTVTFDLTNCPSKTYYDISFKLRNQNGLELVPQNSLTGDLNRVSCGVNKKIEWNVLQDQSSLRGSYKAVIGISKTYSPKVNVAGGPTNALLSMLLPGVGDFRVNKNPTQGILVMGCFLGAVGSGTYFKIESDKYYKQYHSATTQNEMDATYKSANDRNISFQLMMGVAASIWVADVIYVAVKGSKNRREQLEGNARNKPNVNLYLRASNNLQIGIMAKF